MGHKVLITGGFGFIGAHVCGHLAASGHQVAVFDDCRLGRPENLPSVVRSETLCTVGDIRDSAALLGAVRAFGPEVVVHLAAIHFIPLCDSQPRLAVDVNVGGTQSVLDACREVDTVAGIVFASSGAVYEPSEDAVGENHQIAPIDIYGLTKLWGEQLVRLHRENTGMGVAIARLFNVYGPRETNPHFIPSLLWQVARGRRLELGNLATRRDYVYAEDVAAAVEKLAEHACSDTAVTYNIGTGTAHTGKEILSEIEAIVDRDLVPQVDNQRLRTSDRPVLLSDSSYARDMLGWTASTPLGSGLERALMDPVAAGVEIA